MTNPSTVYARLFVDELAKSGLQDVCLTPGSRNTPLVLAFAEHPAIKTYSHLDERSAAFFALGIAMAKDSPVAMVCTSGTGGANYYPAVVEAHQNRVPLIILTADRPPELRHSGANQTIDQIKLFGDFVLWFVDAPLPEQNPPDETLRHMRTLANRAYATANGNRKGAVHINLPFRKPLEPTAEDRTTAEYQTILSARATSPATHFTTGTPTITSNELTFVENILSESKSSLIICGTRCPGDEFPQRLVAFAQQWHMPILADGVSGIRFGHDTPNSPVIGGYDTFLQSYSPDVDVLLHFGNVPTSKTLNTFLSNLKCKHRIAVSRDGVWADDKHLMTHFLHVDPLHLVEQLNCNSDLNHRSTVIDPFRIIEQMTREVIQQEIETGDYFDGTAVYDVIRLMPDDGNLFVGNSLPVRHLDQFGLPTPHRIHAYANRGASGIDGNTSTALGIGAGHPQHPLVAIVGDITLYHDMNGLLAVHRCDVPVTIILLNNGGGGIFHRLPINQYDPEFTEFFVTPHGLDFSHTAALYGLNYVVANSRETFQTAFDESVSKRTPTIIEVQTNARDDLRRRNEIVQRVQERIRNIE